ncbi:class D sortase [Bacillus sp. DNRA2]|uniref:class D sortase n=1 Tax=Bacillus sp. DNRA2 TaxID=2723053 RepID=UPI00145FB914|nr:class D sortase [Bacillus sp. DNRA2]NMD72268.1 class D sortase [Bacillus sp. DNRA2]
MVRKLSILLIIVGLIIIGYSAFQIFKTKTVQTNSLEKAHEILKKPKVDIEDFSPFMGDVVGILSIPRIDAELPIVEGTDADDLEKGVGHYKGTAWPMGNDQIVLSGHRDTVFRRMGELEIGDELIVKVPYGEFSYKIEGTKVVDADDLTVIKPTAPNEVLTVTTCYPFRYVGNAPQRYIINAKPVNR